LNVLDKPTLLIFNKIDLYRKRNYDHYLDEEAKKEIEEGLQSNLKHLFELDNVFISAITKENMSVLRYKLVEMVQKQYQVRYPYQAHHW